MFLPLHRVGRLDLWRRELGCDFAHWAAAGGFPPQGGVLDIGETDLA